MEVERTDVFLKATIRTGAVERYSFSQVVFSAAKSAVHCEGSMSGRCIVL